MVGDIKYNNIGIFVSRDGLIFNCDGTDIIDFDDIIKPKISDSNYPVIDFNDIKNMNQQTHKTYQNLRELGNKEKIYVNGTEFDGEYVHRIIVFTFGDCNNKPFGYSSIRTVIDHKNMNHFDSSVENLEQITNGMNLFRAYMRTSKAYRNRFEKEFLKYMLNLKVADEIKFGIECELIRKDIHDNF